MKRIITMLFVVLAMAGVASAQDQATRRAEMVQRQTERLVKEFDLKGEAKDKFVSIFTEYQNALAETYVSTERPKEEIEPKDMTDEQANAAMQKYFDQQETEVAAVLMRYQVRKQYYDKMATMLTPQQLVRVFASQQRRMGGGPQGGGRGGQGGYRGGPRGGQGGYRGGDFGGEE